jgi:hypothetical protein
MSVIDRYLRVLGGPSARTQLGEILSDSQLHWLNATNRASTLSATASETSAHGKLSLSTRGMFLSAWVRSRGFPSKGPCCRRALRSERRGLMGPRWSGIATFHPSATCRRTSAEDHR